MHKNIIELLEKCKKENELKLIDKSDKINLLE